jgi:hypothetical protein
MKRGNRSPYVAQRNAGLVELKVPRIPLRCIRATFINFNTNKGIIYHGQPKIIYLAAIRLLSYRHDLAWINR